MVQNKVFIVLCITQSVLAGSESIKNYESITAVQCTLCTVYSTVPGFTKISTPPWIQILDLNYLFTILIEKLFNIFCFVKQKSATHEATEFFKNLIVKQSARSKMLGSGSTERKSRILIPTQSHVSATLV